MPNFHRFLDRVFHRALSFSIFWRIWLAIVFVMLIVGGISLYALQKTIQPQAKTVVEHSLADTAKVLALLLSDEMTALQQGDHQAFTLLNNKLGASTHSEQAISTLHIYITDEAGIVLYDSFGRYQGADFSQWNDVYLTRQGKYGARTTAVDGETIMYVASPIMHNNQLMGVVSVGKPTHTLAPYLSASFAKLLAILGQSFVISLVIAALMASWLRHSITKVGRFAIGLGLDRAPHFYLGNELNELTANITQMKDAIENKAYVSDYVHTLTHELKSPLSAIKASGEILAGAISDKDRVFFATLIGSQSDKLTRLIDKLLTLARLEQPTIKLHKEPLQVLPLIKECLVALQAVIHDKKLVVDISGDGTLFADRFWLLQALQNVLDNAVRHASVFVAIVMTGDKLIVINDTAPLPPFVLERAFERYFTFTINPEQQGTGLGLPLVRTIIELHKGAVTLEQKEFTAGDFWQGVPPDIIERFAGIVAVLTIQLKGQS